MIVVLSGISGVGKTTIAKMLEEHKFVRSVSYTTRVKREGEQCGRDYIFIPFVEFQQKIEESFFLEHVNQFGNSYGSSYEQVEQILEANQKVIMCLSPEGYIAAKNKWGNRTVGIYLLPPSVEELQERLVLRGSEDRLSSVYNFDLQHNAYEHKIQPGALNETFAAVLNIIKNKSSVSQNG